MLKIGIISNPFARLIKKNPEYNTLLWYTLENLGYLALTKSFEELNATCQEFHERQINLIGIVGGDGSIGLVLSAIYEAYKGGPLPKILILKAGTINFLAQNLNLHKTAHECLKDTVRCLKQGQPLFETTLPTLCVNQRLGFLFAGGISSAFLAEFYRHKTNTWGAALQAGRYIIDGLCNGKWTGDYPKLVKTMDMDIKTQPWDLWPQRDFGPKKYSLVFASTVPKAPFGLHFFKLLQKDPQKAQMLATTSTGRQLMWDLLSVLLSKAPKTSHVQSSVLFESLQIDCEPHSPYSLDGDLLETQQGGIAISLGPKFSFCSPYRSH